MFMSWVFEENEEAVYLAQNPKCTSNLTQVGIRRHCLREVVFRKETHSTHADFLQGNPSSGDVAFSPRFSYEYHRGTGVHTVVVISLDFRVGVSFGQFFG